MPNKKIQKEGDEGNVNDSVGTKTEKKEAQREMEKHEPMLVIRNRLRKFFHSTFWQIFSFFSYYEKKTFFF